MSRLLIVLAAVILFGAQLAAPAEAQGWTCIYDFSTGTHGWAVSIGSYTGSEVVHGDAHIDDEYTRRVSLSLSAPGITLTSLTVVHSYVGGAVTSGYSRLTAFQKSPWNQFLVENGTPSSPYTWNGSASISSLTIELQSSRNTSGGYSGSASVSSITLQGTGTAPCAATPTPVPPTATPVPPTATPVDPVMFAQSNWSCPFDLRSHGLQGWQVITGSYVPGAGVQGAYPLANQVIEVTLPLNAGTTLYDIRIEYDSTTGTETVLRADGVTFDDANGLSAGNQIVWWQGNQAFNSSLNIRIIGSLFTPATMHLNSIVLRGYGAAPPCSNSGLPQPSPTPQVIDAGNLWAGLVDANNTLNGLNPNSVGGGVPAETGRALFGYVKWIVSPSSADELAGPFAPLISHTGVFIALMFALILVYAIVWAVIWILRFIYWLYRLIVQIIDLVLQVAQVIGAAIGSAGQLVGSFISSAIKFLF